MSGTDEETPPNYFDQDPTRIAHSIEKSKELIKDFLRDMGN